MNVQSKPTRKPSAIIKGATLDRARPHFERSLALMLLALSIAGSVIAFHGSWSEMLAHPSWERALAGTALQVCCTVIEWLYRNNRRSIIYLVVLFLDAGMTVAGYGPIFHTPFTAALSDLFGDLSSWVAWGIIGALALLLAWVPEGRLIDD